MSRFDKLYRQLIFTGFFKRGWGDPALIQDLLHLRMSLSDPRSVQSLQITNELLRNVRVDIEKETRQDGMVFLDASFVSPMHTILPHMMPVECRIAKFQLMYNEKASSNNLPPVALHLAGTGDHYFYRRRVLQGNPLLKGHGINSAFLENPFYGCRKPKDQLRSSVHYVNDIFIMGAALILESWVVLNWLRKNKFGSSLCLTGVSMGGFMASLAAGFWRECPVALVPCLAWSSAAPVFTEGVLADALPWQSLSAQFHATPALREIQRGICRGDYGAKYINGGFSASSSSSSYDDDDDSPILADAIRRMPNLIESPPISNATTTSRNQPTREFSTSSSDTSYVSWGKRTPKGDRDRTPDDRDYPTAKNFMRNLMDQFTHLGNYSPPMDPNLTQFLVATKDGYVPSHANDAFLQRRKQRRGDNSVSISDDMRTVWPGCSTIELRDCGHVGAYLFKQKEYTKVIWSNIEKLNSIYHSPNP